MRNERSVLTKMRARDLPLGPILLVFFVGMTALAAFLLVRPLLSPLASEGYYHPPQYAFTYGFNKPMLALFVPYALALMAWWRGNRVALKWLLGGAILLHVLLTFAPPPASQDMGQYLFYGRMQAVYHINPYTVQPLAQYLDPWFSWIRWPTQTTVYGPVWTLGTALVVSIAGSSHTMAYLAMKLVVLGLDLTTMAMILAAARDTGRERGAAEGEFAAGFGILAYALNPLVLLSVPLSGLADVALAAGLTAAYVARRRGHPWVTTVLLAATTLVKVYAGVALLLHLVLLARERGPRRAAGHALLSGGMATIASAPYWAGFATFAGVLHIAGLSNHSLAGTIQRLLAPVFSAIGIGGSYGASKGIAGALVRWIGTGLLAACVVWCAARVRTERDLWHGTLLVLTVYCLVTPWFLFWYLVAPIALVAVMPRDRLTAPVLTASGTLLITTAFPPWLLAQVLEVVLRYVPPLAAFVAVVRREARGARVGLPGSAVVPPAAPFARGTTAAR